MLHISTCAQRRTRRDS